MRVVRTTDVYSSDDQRLQQSRPTLLRVARSFQGPRPSTLNVVEALLSHTKSGSHMKSGILIKSQGLTCGLCRIMLYLPEHMREERWPRSASDAPPTPAYPLLGKPLNWCMRPPPSHPAPALTCNMQQAESDKSGRMPESAQFTTKCARNAPVRAHACPCTASPQHCYA